MKKITNDHGIDLPIAVWLLQNGYNSGAKEAPEGELISVTTLLKPVRSLILQRHVDQTKESVDLADLVSSRMGHSLHDGIERAWTEGDWQGAMRRMHYSQDVIDQIKINPDPSSVGPDDIPIYLEQRRFKEIGGVVLTGQLDFCINGAYRDTKSTSVFSYMSDSKDDDFILQGSMYRYIMPEIIKKDKMRIEFLFTDWQKFMAKNNPNYPQAKAAHKEYPLMSLEATEQWILDRLDVIKKNAKYVTKQDKLIRCTEKELWKSEDKYSYYAKPETAAKGGRAQKNFKSFAEAEQHRTDKGKGVVKKIPGVVKACQFCAAFPICDQRKEYFPDDHVF